MILLHVAFAVTKWSTTSDRLNSIINWGAVAGYQLIVVLFTLHRPRWLTTISAIILILPVFASNILLPLVDLFSTTSPSISRIDGRYINARNLWNEPGENHNSGVGSDGLLPAPLLTSAPQGSARSTFNDMQCDASASSASIDRVRKIIHFHCPASPTGHGSDPIDLLLHPPLTSTHDGGTVNMMTTALLQTDLGSLPLTARGKVRESTPLPTTSSSSSPPTASPPSTTSSAAASPTRAASSRSSLSSGSTSSTTP